MKYPGSDWLAVLHKKVGFYRIGPTNQRGGQHVNTDWTKIKMRLQDIWDSTPPMEERIMQISRGGVTHGVLMNRIRPKTESERLALMEVIEKLVASGRLIRKKEPHGKNKIEVVTYFDSYTEKEKLERRKVFDIYSTPVGGFMEFDVSRECFILLADIRDMVNMCTWMHPHATFSVTLLDDAKILVVECISRAEEEHA